MRDERGEQEFLVPDIQNIKPLFRGRLREVDQGNDILVTSFDCLRSGSKAV
jgi:hypothetical protein